MIFPEKEDERNFCSCSGIYAYFAVVQGKCHLKVFPGFQVLFSKKVGIKIIMEKIVISMDYQCNKSRESRAFPSSKSDMGRITLERNALN